MADVTVVTKATGQTYPSASDLGSGTPTGAKYLRDDMTWQVPPSGPGGSLIGQIVAQVWRSVTMTNIGASYKDIYSGTTFDEEHLSYPDFANVTDIRVVFLWDYVGTGTQQLRLVDLANNTNVLWESATFTADQDPGDSGWVTKPAWATGAVKLEWQGKSTQASDDPIAKGYIVYAR